MDGSQPRARRQEQEQATTEVTEVAPNVLRTQLPISLPGLGHVNCYLLQDERGVAVVDPGLPGPQSWRALVDRLKRAGYKPADVHTVVVTHSHPDHFGGAGRLRDRYGAEVVTHRSFSTWFDPTDDDTFVDEAGDPLPRPTPFGHSVPWRDDHIVRPPLRRRLQLRFARVALTRFTRTPSPTRRVDDAEVIRLAGREWVSVHTPGHTADHLCLYDPVEGVVLSGDHVLPTITPHISGLARPAGGDALSAFFESLEKVGRLKGVRQVLPAHGHPFADLSGRAEAIRYHHEDRLQVLRDATAELGSATVEQLSHRLFRERSWGPMAESETYAHLEHLRVIGEAEARKERGLLRYQLTG
ncbi:MAG TPA: MBL fold metallo-hydrolase [Acidimicrobiales bacterium]|jgi:glyoxylase-like metal-dependent hydrolase (beta-lactamase superfamily II)|nr:MBL fold metallo-hydrolase [Acidimicrobiales bacterium]